jgi:hypothetical protein
MSPLFLLPVLFWLVIIGGGFHLAVRLIRAVESRGTDKREVEDLRERVRNLEATLDTMSTEIRRVSEAQNFTMNLLEGRGSAPDR